MTDNYAFMEWIKNEMNPLRIKKGLPAINDDEAEKCWKIISDFTEKIRTSPINRTRVNRRSKV